MASAVVTLPATNEKLTIHRRSLKALTGIRFFAAGYVVVFHTQVGHHLYDSGRHAAGTFFMNGYLAVPLFFILSGFILAYTYRGQMRKPGCDRRFWEARFSRLWPAYMISLLSVSIPSLVFPKATHMLAAIFMVQTWNPWFLGLGSVWNYVCWSLSAEAFFYVVFPWVQRWVERRTVRGEFYFALAALAVCVLINSGIRSIGYTETGMYTHIPLPVLHLPEFLVGVGLGNVFLNRLLIGRIKLPGGGAFTYVALAASLGLLLRAESATTSIVIIAFAALVYGLASEETFLSRLLGSPAGVFGGGISYSMYLMQLPVRAWTVSVGERLHVGNRDLVQIMAGVVLLLVSTILFKVVENPSRDLLRRLFAGVESRHSAAMQHQTREREGRHHDDWRTEGSKGS